MLKLFRAFLLTLLILLTAHEAFSQSPYYQYLMNYTSATDFVIRANTVDGVDNTRIRIAGGGAADILGTRGAGLDLNGEQFATEGSAARLYAGNNGIIYFNYSGKQRWYMSMGGATTWSSLSFGDGAGGTVKEGMIKGSSSNGADDQELCVTAAGSCSSTRGAFFQSFGSQWTDITQTPPDTFAGQAYIATGNVATGHLNLDVLHPSATGRLSANGHIRWYWDGNGDFYASPGYGRNLLFYTRGSGFQIKETSGLGSGRMGLITCNAASDVIENNSTITALTRIFLTAQEPVGAVAVPHVVSRSAGASFTINCVTAGATGTVAYLLVESL